MWTNSCSILLSAVPTPGDTTSFNPSRGPYYTGQQLIITCTIVNAVQYPGTTADILLVGPTGEVIADSRITVVVIEPVADLLFIGTYTISTLSKIMDDGSYTCMGTIRPVDLSIQQYVTNGVTTADPSTLTVVGMFIR